MENKLTHHPILNKHASIGIDVDLTLIDGPCSHFLQSWVWDHYKELDLHLITFRYGVDFDHYLKSDLAEVGMDFNMFKGIHGIPAVDAVPFWLLVNKVGHKNKVYPPKWHRSLKHHKSSPEEYDQLFQVVSTWKGQKCKELGITALVDDLGDMVKPGCDLHGIEWIDSFDL
jgi:hypothetical protein